MYMKSWDSNSVHSHFALIIKAQCFWLLTLLRKDEQNTFTFLNTTSVKQWSLKRSSYTTSPPICSSQTSSRRTLENRNSKREEMLSDLWDHRIIGFFNHVPCLKILGSSVFSITYPEVFPDSRIVGLLDHLSASHKMNIKEECRESWYFLFRSSYPDTRF